VDGDPVPDRCFLDQRDRVVGVMTEELIKRLREDDTDPVMLKKAADTIEAQAAEIAEYRRHHCTVVEITRPLLDALETQATSIKRLREALRGMVEYSRFNERWQEAHPEYVEAARAALGETE
jgi:hypothetical protein